MGFITAISNAVNKKADRAHQLKLAKIQAASLDKQAEASAKFLDKLNKQAADTNAMNSKLFDKVGELRDSNKQIEAQFGVGGGAAGNVEVTNPKLAALFNKYVPSTGQASAIPQPSGQSNVGGSSQQSPMVSMGTVPASSAISNAHKAQSSMHALELANAARATPASIPSLGTESGVNASPARATPNGNDLINYFDNVAQERTRPARPMDANGMVAAGNKAAPEQAGTGSKIDAKIDKLLAAIAELIALKKGETGKEAPKATEGAPAGRGSPAAPLGQGSSAAPASDPIKGADKAYGDIGKRFDDHAKFGEDVNGLKAKIEKLIEAGVISEAEGKQLIKALEGGLEQTGADVMKSGEGENKFADDVKALGPQLDQLSKLTGQANSVLDEISSRVDAGELSETAGAKARSNVTRGLEDARSAVLKPGDSNEIHGKSISDAEILGSVGDKLGKLDVNLDRLAASDRQADAARGKLSSMTDSGSITEKAASAGLSAINEKQTATELKVLQWT